MRQLQLTHSSSFLLLFSFCFLLSACGATPPLLTVVGDVTTSTARIVYDPIEAGLHSPSTLKMKVVEEASSRHLVTADVPLSAYPLAVEVRGLRPAVMYKVLFLSAPSSAGQGEASGPRVVGSVSFFTLSSDAAPVHLPVMSCNRVNEDEDVAFAEGISVDQNKRTGAVHLGDQVYADRPVSEARSALERGDGEKASARSAMTRLRNLYRSVFGSASTHAVLSSAPNWMIPDDHDIANNVDGMETVLEVEGWHYSGRG
uniref:PhoD-like phosphatase metallophosphatase domain-containing protein n=1 Tax=Palpitomonas bilix TaxID=652834 RepID=A0A7S3LSF1_9EUKA|mmetsp:Transcript_4428/g.9050  ORF Transcript_4428/g.9050 Transcript_4428/m.9050 type:complete len:258 (+) Transcript_4428:72-845(+)